MHVSYATRLTIILSGILLRVIFPTAVGAVVTETLKLVPSDGLLGDDFGYAVAVGSGLAVVGAPGSGTGGAVYIFDTATGQELQKLVPTDLTAGALFGSSIAVDGNLAVIGAQGQDIGGSAYVFDLNTGNQVAKLVSTEVSAGDLLGWSVAISGNTVVAGAPGNDDAFDNAGSVYLFDVTTGDQLAKLNAAIPVESAGLGDSVAFDGGYVAAYDKHVHGPYDSTLNAQSVSLFDPLTGNQIAEVLQLASSLVGTSVAIAGNRLLVGAPSNFPGAASDIYDISDPNNITGMAIPWPDGGGGFFFGISVALNDEVALISTYFSEEIGASGIVHMFDPDTGDLLESFQSSSGVDGDFFGWSIGLGGQTLIAGAPFEDNTGAAYLFTIPEPATLAVFLVVGPALMGRRGTGRGGAVHGV